MYRAEINYGNQACTLQFISVRRVNEKSVTLHNGERQELRFENTERAWQWGANPHRLAIWLRTEANRQRACTEKVYRKAKDAYDYAKRLACIEEQWREDFGNRAIYSERFGYAIDGMSNNNMDHLLAIWLKAKWREYLK